PHGPLLRSTLQLGDPAVIAERCGLTVVADFRARDVAAGGSGAPLTPWAHDLLFSRTEAPSAFLNLGGISNLTYIPPAGEEGLFGFDAGPANMAIDALARRLSGGAESFDRDGALAARGEIDEAALARLLEHPFLSSPPPKSTGRESFGEAFLDSALALMDAPGARGEDQLATLTAFSAECVIRAVRDHFPRDAPPAEIVVGGGGVRNRTLMRLLEEGLSPVPLVSSGDRGLPPDAVEAVSFALLAWATLRGVAANVPAATGASRKVVLGHITPGRNFY
ncbi:MAG: anhydro-N-acetylmuramic acid kinase, partial [bacterium]